MVPPVFIHFLSPNSTQLALGGINPSETLTVYVNIILDGTVLFFTKLNVIVSSTALPKQPLTSNVVIKSSKEFYYLIFY